jgi:hypothetical protein
VLGLCSVIFDVDKGQTLQDLWPPDCLSEEDKAAVAFHAFPVGGSSFMDPFFLSSRRFSCLSTVASQPNQLPTAHRLHWSPGCVCWHAFPDYCCLPAGLPFYGAIYPQRRQGQVSTLPAHMGTHLC